MPAYHGTKARTLGIHLIAAAMVVVAFNTRQLPTADAEAFAQDPSAGVVVTPGQRPSPEQMKKIQEAQAKAAAAGQQPGQQGPPGAKP